MFGFVRQSGGFLRLESKVGLGTTIRIYLPCYETDSRRENGATASGSDAQAANDRRAATTIGGTVLVVEDEADVRAMIVGLLQDLGCQVLQAADGSAGLRIIQTGWQADLLVTDVGLPGLNGRQLADAARERRPDLPVLLITGYAGRALEDTALEPGMEVMRKPFALDALRVRVGDLLSLHTPTDNPASKNVGRSTE